EHVAQRHYPASLGLLGFEICKLLLELLRLLLKTLRLLRELLRAPLRFLGLPCLRVELLLALRKRLAAVGRQLLCLLGLTLARLQQHAIAVGLAVLELLSST